MVTLGKLGEFTTAHETFEVVNSFTFLGARIDRDEGSKSEIARRIAMGKSAMTGLCRVMKERAISVPTKVRRVKALVFPVMTYGCESWTIRKSERSKIDAFELWCWQGLLRVPWTEGRTDKSILDELRTETSLEAMIFKRGQTFFGHAMRASGIEKDVMLGKVEGTRRCGR